MGLTSWISALGDSAVLLPASLLLLLYLAATRHWNLAAAWMAALATAGLATIGSKLVFHACGPAITDFDVVSPSGHTSFSAIFYGALAVLLAAGRPRPVRVALGGGAVLGVLAIGASRVRLGAHSVEEVAIGLAIGAAAVSVFAWLHRKAGGPAIAAWPLLVGVALVMLALGGNHFSLEHRIAAAARRAASILDVCAPT